MLLPIGASIMIIVRMNAAMSDAHIIFHPRSLSMLGNHLVLGETDSLVPLAAGDISGYGNGQGGSGNECQS